MKNKKNVVPNKVQAVGAFLNRNAGRIAICMMAVMMLSSVVFANTADSLWQQISTLIQKWVTRLGAVVIFVGGIMFGLGWRSEDAEQKSRGISTIIAGAIVMAVAGLTSTFFA